MSRVMILAAIVIGSFTVAATASAGENAAVGQTVYLTVREPEGYDPQGAVAAPLLDRELVRQAFLIAARDELGLSTRDVLLREDFPATPDDKARPFELFCRSTRVKKDFDVDYFLHRKQQGSTQQLWKWTFNVDINNPRSLTSLTEKAEALSRGELKEVLTRDGWGHSVPAARATSEVPSETADLLWTWNEISVLAGLRRVHAEIRDKGESPELLAALAVGYANLGTISEYHYAADFKAYSARSLLYAERLLHKTDSSPWALWHRAYVRMIVGLHNFAAEDIAEAKKKQGDSAPAKPLPFWSEVIEAFGQGELPRMIKSAKTPPQRQLARYLNLYAVMFGDLKDLRVRAARDFLKECPNSPRVQNVLSSDGELGTLGHATASSFQLTGALWRKRVPRVPGLPESLAKQIRDTDVNTETTAEVAFRKEFIANLKKAGAPDLDRTEPSLSAVGHALEELEFAQFLRRIEFEGNSLGVSTMDTIATYGPLCETHPYFAYVSAYTFNRKQVEAAAAVLAKKIEIPATTIKERTFLQWLYSVTPTQRWHDLFQAPYLHLDMTFGDEMRGILAGLAGPPDDRKYNRWYMMKTWNTSNKLPLSVAMRISRDWAHARQETDIRERDYADDPLVMNALASRYYQLKRYDDAERCAKRQVAVAPGFPAYHLLASVYKAKEDHARWKETLDKALELPANGLEHASIRNEIALDLLERMEWTEAVVYADLAAESYSAWSMLTAARCHEVLGDWKKSEQFVRAVSERYGNLQFTWFFWCHRTGHGDVAAAEDFTRKQIESMGTDLYTPQYTFIGFYYVLTGEPDKAFLLFQRSYEKRKDPQVGLHAALLADSLGKTAERDTLLQQVIDIKLPANYQEAKGSEYYGQLAAQFRKLFPPDEAKQLDLPEVDKILATAAPATLQPSRLPYFVGLFLKNRGNAEGAKAYLLRFAKANDWEVSNHVLACRMLRDMKVKLPALEPAPAKSDSAKTRSETNSKTE